MYVQIMFDYLFYLARNDEKHGINIAVHYIQYVKDSIYIYIIHSARLNVCIASIKCGTRRPVA